MNITFQERGCDIIFIISNYDIKYEPVLKMCYFEKEGNSFIKKYNKNIRNIQIIKNNFLNHAEEMFSQLGYFTNIPWEDALLEFIKRVEGKNINWWLTGSCACCIRGIKLNPHDVDIMVDSKDVEKLNELFLDCMVEPLVDTNGWVTKDFGVLFKQARIDIASDPSSILDEPTPIDCGPYARAHLEAVMFKGYKVLVPPLTLSLNVNKKRKRLERVKLIEDFINKNRPL